MRANGKILKNRKEKTMIFQNIDFHNVSELTENGDGGYTMHRFPVSVEEELSDQGKIANKVSTGVELRFRMISDSVKIKLKYSGKATNVNVYRGGVIGSWDEVEVPIIGGEVYELTVAKKNTEALEKINNAAHFGFSHEIVRVVFNSASLDFYGIDGEVLPPEKEQLPEKTYLAYGSSITHGSNAVAIPSSFAFRVAEQLRTDYLNLGLAGACRMEKGVIDTIAAMGAEGKWDFATVCLGINVLGMEEAEFRSRVRYTVETITAKNPEKHVFFISPIFCHNDMIDVKAARWREVVGEETMRITSPFVHYINGLELLGDPSGLSGDYVHPSPMGIDQITSKLVEKISTFIN